MSGVVAIVAAPRLDGPETTEFLRALAALRAVGVPVRLVEAGAAAGRLRDGDALSADGERFLDALATADAILRLADPGRPGIPGLLAWPRGARPSPTEVAALLAAGQVQVP